MDWDTFELDLSGHDDRSMVVGILCDRTISSVGNILTPLAIRLGLLRSNGTIQGHPFTDNLLWSDC